MKLKKNTKQYDSCRIDLSDFDIWNNDLRCLLSDDGDFKG